VNIDAKLINQILDVSQLSQGDRATTRLLPVLRGECRYVRASFLLIQRQVFTGIYIQTEPMQGYGFDQAALERRVDVKCRR
jgi:hypothetical protein